MGLRPLEVKKSVGNVTNFQKTVILAIFKVTKPALNIYPMEQILSSRSQMNRFYMIKKDGYISGDNE